MIEKIEKSRKHIGKSRNPFGQSRNREIQRGGASDREIRKCNMGASWASKAKRRPAGDSRIEKIKKSRKTQWKIKKSNRAIEKSRNPCPVGPRAQRVAGGDQGFPGSKKSRNRENTMENPEIQSSDREIEKSMAGGQSAPRVRTLWIARFLDCQKRFLDFPLCFLDFLIFSILETPASSRSSCP